MESEPGSGNIKHSTVPTESSHANGDPVVKGKLSRSSSSSSDSSFDPLTESDNGKKEVLDNSNSLPEGLSQTPDWSMVSSSPRAGPGPLSSPEHSLQIPEWRTLSASPKQSPPTQMMGRAGSEYDPNRIPSSVFASKPSTPMEWSVASNESLFSIHMGNNSFSRDYAIMLYKSGELTKPDDINNFKSNQRPVTEAKSNELNNAPSSLPTVNEVASDNHGSASNAEDSHVKASADEMPKETQKTPPADGVHTSASTPRLSDESGNSSSSFAFPVLTGEAGKIPSVKVAPENLQSNPPEKPESQPQAPVANPPKPAETKWFSCFPCC
ncbi:hypothetical protein HYC85_004789 [Camellia sinensis]|uniref:Uncharacterized protein n=1 Tax=Camellia sinensis TaxID=4442 RepID=A0A7J7HZI5_CAMSI|nr:hypothetical protein HYC85_004789 [Camellia sinensis]